MVDYPDGFARSLHELTRLIVDEEPLDKTLERVVELACFSLEGCDVASMTLKGNGTRDGESPRTPAYTDKAALEIDEAQYAADNGPCLEAYRSKTVVEVKSTAGDEVFREFSASAHGHGIESSMSVPLVARGEGLGALNLYSRRVAGFTGEDHDRGVRFAEQAAVAIRNAEVYWRTYDMTRNLQIALESRDVIGQAKGILMARRVITAEAAFDLLRRESQRSNVKLRDLADTVALTGELPPD